jgi:hypothetical protein
MGLKSEAKCNVHYEMCWIWCKCGSKEEREVTQVDIFSAFDTIIVGVNLK